MSSTNRGAERHPHDFYATPADTTRALVRWLLRRGEFPERTLDPFAGDGAILRVLREEGHCPTRLNAVEIRPEIEAPLREATDNVTIGDWFAMQPERRAHRGPCLTERLED